MGLLNKIRDQQDRRAYERSVRVRERSIPYGEMYSRLLAYRRATQQYPNLATNPSPERLAAKKELKLAVRDAFMSHPAATEQDFERCWPILLDEVLIQYTLKLCEKVELGNNPEHLEKH